MNDLVVITGQTATGKSKFALDLAKRSDGELINADSRQVYEYLDIVTGKDKDELKKSGIKVHLLDVATPNQSFSSYDFVEFAEPIIQDIWKRKKTPIIVGGSYLYIKHLLYGQDINVPPDEKQRKTLNKLSVDKLQEKLLSIDESAQTKMNNSDWNNPRRLIRKIEIATQSVKSKACLPAGWSVKPVRSKKYDTQYSILNTQYKMIGLKHKSRESLVDAITKRVHKRIAQGALQEVKNLLKLGYKKTDPGLQTIGYKQLIKHLEGGCTLEEATADWINKEVQYAKRQYTFMKKDSNIQWREV